MNSSKSYTGWRVYEILLVFILILSSCEKKEVPLVKPSVTIQPATNVTISSATLVASVVPNENGTTVSFEYKIAAAVTDWQIVTLSTTYSGKTSVNVTLDISNLSSQTEYSYRVKATSAAGQSISAINTFTTLAAPVKAGVAIKPAVNVEITKATLVAEVVPNEPSTSIVFDYKAQADANWTSVPVAGLFSGKTSIEVSITLTTLVANTEYSYRVKATNVAGETISSESKFQAYALKDYDGNYYHTITIGTQTWLKENLKTTHFANGDPIPNVTDATAWTTLTTGAYCWYNNDLEIGKIYGALYNWFITNDPRGLLVGYHVATDSEWTILRLFLGTQDDSIDKSGGKMKEAGTAHWIAPNVGATNESGFTALPSGCKESQTGAYSELGKICYMWSSTGYGGTGAFGKRVMYNFQFFENNVVNFKQAGYALRLIKN